MKHIIKKGIAIMILVTILLGIVGCLNPVSLDAYGYVVSIGVDKGKEKKYYVTLALQREGTAQGNETEGGASFHAAEGDNLYQVINVIESNVSYSLNFTRTNFFMFSREIAESGLMQDFLSISFDSLRIRTSALIIITQQTVLEFFGGLSANNSANINKLQTSLLRDQQGLGAITLVNISEFMESCNEQRYDICAAIGQYEDTIVTDMEQKKSESEGKNPLKEVEVGDRLGGLKSYTAGSALFDGWVMTGVLDPMETQFLNIARGEFKIGSFTLSMDESIMITVQLKTIKSGHTVEFTQDGKIHAITDVELTVSIMQKSSDIPEKQVEEWVDGYLTEYIKGNLDSMLAKCKECDSDVVGYGVEVSKLFGSVAEWERFNWKENYSDTTVEFNVALLLEDKYIAEDMQ